MAEFTEEELAAEAATNEAEQQETPTERNERLRDEMGRFAAQQQETQEGDQQQRESKVPHGALHAERESHKQTKAQLQAAQEQLQRIAEMRARIMQPQQEEAKPTDPAQDPTGVEYLKQRLAQVEGTVQQREQETHAATLNQREYEVLQSQLVASEAEFRQQTPDYDKAAEYLANARAAELQMYGLQPHEIMQQLQEEVREITKSAIALGRSPAELAYNIARTRGYNGQAPQNGNNAGHAMLDAIAQGQKSRSLSSARGSGGSAEPNVAAIASMSEEEFTRNMKNPEFAAMVATLG